MELVIGSCAQIEPSLLQQLGVHVLEFPLFLDGLPYVAPYGIGRAEKDALRTILLAKKQTMSTAGIREADILACYERLAGKPILAFHTGETFSSATYAALRKVGREHPEHAVKLADSAHTTAGYSVQVLQIARALRDGLRGEALDRQLAALRRDTVHIGVVRDLFYMSRTGRIGMGRALLGTVLRLIPLLVVRDGEGVAKPLGKVRSPAQANALILETIRADAGRKGTREVDVAIAWFGQHRPEAEQLGQSIRDAGFRGALDIAEGNATGTVHLGGDYWEIGYTVHTP
ncbi:MAG: DegV family EDD domain-containing protein [Myxococcales bacterium]|nr:DegV family EDD domain-containing protein [Myxococcales bacterium]